LGRDVFESWRSYWKYEEVIKRHARYIRPPEIESFLHTVLDTAEKRIEEIPKGEILWRAQLGNDWRQENEEVGEVEVPYPPERMKPMLNRANEGRANPKGIPYLYFASNRETALAEVRPWIGSYISVGQFKTLKDLKVVNCTTESKRFRIYFEEPPAEKREEAVWAGIDRAFATPVTTIDDSADYAPTQVIAEFFKINGFDGIMYRSSLGKGKNIALFEIQSADIIKCFLFEHCCPIKFKEKGQNPHVLCYNDFT